MNRLAVKVADKLGLAGVRPTDGMVVAVSGGPDSMALLDVLRTRANLVVGHVNHGLRATAERDEKLVAKYCQQHNLKFESERVNLGRKVAGIEERARVARYAALVGMAKRHRVNWIVTAHTADDQVETVVANWLRGSLVRGLGGMRLRSGQIVRPLLEVTKRELLDYARTHQLKYAIDPTNRDIKFTRNRIRHDLLPMLRKYNPQLDSQLLRNSQSWQQIDQALADVAKHYLMRIGVRTKGKLVLSVSKLKELTPVMQGEVIKLALGGQLAELKQVHFEEVMKILASPRSTVAKRRLGGKLFASKAYDKITISQL